MNFEFYYKINDKLVEDGDAQRDILTMKYREKEYFEKYGKILDKSKIPAGNYCNNENYCCPYCVCDSCLLYGARMESKSGYYGFSFQKRKKRCKYDYPKGKDLTQVEFDLKGGEER